MSAVTAPTPVTPSPAPPPVRWRTVAELLRDLGDIPADRVRLSPTPGTATEADAYRVNEHECLCELVDGTLVEKAMSTPESFLGALLITYLNTFVLPRRAGAVIAADAQFRMTLGNIREPDVSFTRRDRLPNPLPQVGGWCPDLCVEILSPSNTRDEMARKRGEYFASGCRLVWEIDPRTRSADVYTDPTAVAHLDESGTLDGGTVLPGFTLPLRTLFAEYDAILPTTPDR